jgi:DNA invertase Pin-like site-specific DNA recombinase
MTNLNEQQQFLLDEVVRTKAEVDADLQILAKQQAQERAEIQEPLRVAAQRAADAGVPARRIGFALQTSDHKTIKRFTGDLSVTEVGN